MRALILGLVVLASTLTGPTHADGPALAHLTIEGRTLTLSAENPAWARPMISVEGDSLVLQFAQLHLGFPTPPILDIGLERRDGAWHVTALTLQRPSTGPQLALDPERARILSAEGEDRDLRIRISVEAMVSGGTAGPEILPVEIEIQLSSP